MDEHDSADGAPSKEPSPAKTPKQRTRRRRWLRRSAVTFVVVSVGYTLFGFFGVPALIQRVAIPRFSDRLNGVASLERAAFNPFTLALTLEGFAIDDDAGRRVASFDRFDGDFELLATVFRPGFRFKRAAVTAPSGLAEVSAGGRVNLLDLVKPPAQPKQGEPLRTIPRIVIAELAVADASATVRDETPTTPFEKQLTDLDFTLLDLDTDPEHQNDFTINAALADGTAVTWEGSFFVNPLTASGSITLTGLDLSSFMPYAAEMTSVRLASGRASLELAYEIAPTRDADRAAVTLSTVLLEDVRIEESNGEPILAAPRVELAGIDADADARRLAVATVRVDGAALTSIREEDGSFRAVRFEQEAQETAEAAAARRAARANRVDVQTIEYPLVQLTTAIQHLVEDLQDEWVIAIERVEVGDTGVTFEDRSTSPPVRAVISEISLAAGPVRSEEEFRAPFSFAGLMNGSPIRAEGEVRPLEVAAEVQAAGEQLALAPFAPYLPTEFPEPAPTAQLAGGEARFDGAATLRMRASEALTVTWNGSLGLQGLEAQSPDDGSTLLSLDALGIDGEASLQLLETGPTLAWDGETTVDGALVDADLGQPLRAQAGSARVAGALRYDGAADGLRFTGDVEATVLELDAPEINGLEFAGDTATMTGIDFDQGAMSVSIDRVGAQGPFIRQRMALTPPAEAAEASTNEEAPPVEVRGVTDLPLAINVGQVGIRAGRVEVIDEALGEEPAAVVDDIEIDLANIVTDGATPADLGFSASVQGSGSIAVNGQVDPFRAMPFADVVVEVQTVPLRPYSPLAEPRLGFEIDRGRASVSVPIRAEEGRVEGNLDVLLDAFYLGDRVEAPQAPDLPMKLGLNLLRNRSDEIKVRVPFEGEMTDPKFTLGGVISKAFFDLLGRAVTAPFQLLANAIGGGPDLDLSQVAFDPGSAALTPEAMRVVDTLGRALYERPGLQLEVVGVFDPVADGDALRAANLRADLLARAQAMDTAVVALDDDQYLEQLGASFAEEFPERAPIPVPVPPGSRNQPAPSAEEMESALLAAIEVTDEQFAALARERAEACVEIIISDAGVESDRLRLGASRASEDGETAKAAFDLAGDS